ncbi:MAG: MATE family efflux transporter [Eubacterium sp.]
MLGFVGQSALSAVSLANQYQFILHGVFFGIASGITMLGSQYWGKKDLQSIQAIMGIALDIHGDYRCNYTLCNSDSKAVNAYLHKRYGIGGNRCFLPENHRYLLFFHGYFPVYESTQRSVERAHVSTIITSIALLLNVFLNAVFIFRLFGVPKMGVVGVAIATLIARIVEIVLCMADFLSGKLSGRT